MCLTRIEALSPGQVKGFLPKKAASCAFALQPVEARLCREDFSTTDFADFRDGENRFSAVFGGQMTCFIIAL
jgi:hypothetical protein